MTNKLKTHMISSSLLSLATIIFTVECLIPTLIPVPGVRLGIANIVTIISIYTVGKFNAFLIQILRIILGSLFSGNFVSLSFSLTAGIISCLTLIILSYLPKEFIWFYSTLSSIIHIFTQIVVAMILTKTVLISLYLPILLISSILTGILIGFLAQIILKKLKYIIPNLVHY